MYNNYNNLRYVNIDTSPFHKRLQLHTERIFYKMNNYLKKLEYPKILDILSNYATTYLGKEKCLNLEPSSNKDTVKNMLTETEEALNILYRCNTPPISEITDNTKNLKAIESYSTLSIKSILELTNILKMSEELKKYFYNDFLNCNEFVYLSDIFSFTCFLFTVCFFTLSIKSYL